MEDQSTNIASNILPPILILSMGLSNIIWMCIAWNKKKNCNKMHFFIYSIFNLKLITLILSYLQQKNQLFSTHILCLTEIISNFKFNIFLLLSSSGWLSIKFTSFYNQILKNKNGVIMIIALLGMDVCKELIINSDYKVSYSFAYSMYMFYCLYKIQRLKKKICSIHLLNFQLNSKQISLVHSKEYYLCIKAKRTRFDFLGYTLILSIFSHFLLILLYFTVIIYLQSNISLNLILFYIRTVIIFILIFVYKPSNIDLSTHLCPYKYQSLMKERYICQKAYEINQIYEKVKSQEEGLNEKFFIIINPEEFFVMKRSSQMKRIYMNYMIGNVLYSK